MYYLELHLAADNHCNSVPHKGHQYFLVHNPIRKMDKLEYINIACCKTGVSNKQVDLAHLSTLLLTSIRSIATNTKTVSEQIDIFTRNMLNTLYR